VLGCTIREERQMVVIKLNNGNRSTSGGLNPADWTFAIYQASTDTYQQSVLLNGQPTGTPTQALDCACTLYLADTTDHTP
jgi:hypothetical protein